MTLTDSQKEFVALVLQGRSPSDAYRQAYGGTDNPDSIRSLASRVMRKPAVTQAIREGREAQKADAIASGVWSRRASIEYRIGLLTALEAETRRRADALREYCEGIDNDEVLSDAEKMQKKARARSRQIIGRDTVAAQLSILAALDALSFVADKGDAGEWYDVNPLAHNSPEAREERGIAEMIREDQIEKETNGIMQRLFGPQCLP